MKKRTNAERTQLMKEVEAMLHQSNISMKNLDRLSILRTPQGPSRTSATPTNDKPHRPHVEIYTDGGCEPNPGPGGYGVVLVHPRKRAEASGAFRLTTNNRMEILAAIKGLEMLKRPCTVTVYSDSIKATKRAVLDRGRRMGWFGAAVMEAAAYFCISVVW